MATKTNTVGTLLIGHTADNHLRDTQYAARSRCQDFFDGFKRAVDSICDNADCGVTVGDIFDKSRPSARIIGQLMTIDQELKAKGKVLFACSGNHDWSNPSWVNTLFPGRIGAGSKAGEYVEVPDDVSGIIPVDESQFTFRGHKFAVVKPYSPAAFRSHLAEITIHVRDADVVLYHGMVDGIVPIYTGANSPLTVDELPISKNNKAWLLGDLHMPGYVEPKRPGGGRCLVGYPGSTEMCTSSEPTQKQVQLVLVGDSGAELKTPVYFETRPFITAKVRSEADLDALMERVTPVAEEFPVVNIEFDRNIPQVINRIHSTLDAQRCVIRCYPLPISKTVVERAEDDGPDEEELTMEYFIGERFKKREDLSEVATALFHRDTDADNIISEFIEERKLAFSSRDEG